MTQISNSFFQHGHFSYKSKSKVRVRAHKTTCFKRHVQKRKRNPKRNYNYELTGMLQLLT